jgi:hypothetical protein
MTRSKPSSNFEIINRLGAIQPMRGLSSWKLVSLITLASLCLSVSFPVPSALSQDTPTTTTEQTVSKQELERKARQIVDLLGKGEYNKILEAMSPELRAFWTEEKIKEAWNTRVTSVAGPYKKVLSSNVIDAVNAKLVVVNTQFQKTKDQVVVTFNNQGQPVGIDFPDRRDLGQISRAFINYLAQKNYALARNLLSPLLKAEAFPARVQSGWESLLKQTGPLQKIINVDIKPGAGNDGITLAIAKVQFQKTTRDVFLIFNDQKQITNVDYARN